MTGATTGNELLKAFHGLSLHIESRDLRDSHTSWNQRLPALGRTNADRGVLYRAQGQESKVLAANRALLTGKLFRVTSFLSVAFCAPADPHWDAFLSLYNW
jgi:hypothetical protein